MSNSSSSLSHGGKNATGAHKATCKKYTPETLLSAVLNETLSYDAVSYGVSEVLTPFDFLLKLGEIDRAERMLEWLIHKYKNAHSLYVVNRTRSSIWSSLLSAVRFGKYNLYSKIMQPEIYGYTFDKGVTGWSIILADACYGNNADIVSDILTRLERERTESKITEESYQRILDSHDNCRSEPPLSIALKAFNLSIIRLLLQYGANPLFSSKPGADSSLLEKALSDGCNLEQFKQLWDILQSSKCGDEIKEREPFVLGNAIRTQNEAVVDFICKQNPQLLHCKCIKQVVLGKCTNQEGGLLPLQLAILMKWQAGFKLLRKFGPEIDDLSYAIKLLVGATNVREHSFDAVIEIAGDIFIADKGNVVTVEDAMSLFEYAFECSGSVNADKVWERLNGIIPERIRSTDEFQEWVLLLAYVSKNTDFLFSIKENSLYGNTEKMTKLLDLACWTHFDDSYECVKHMLDKGADAVSALRSLLKEDLPYPDKFFDLFCERGIDFESVIYEDHTLMEYVFGADLPDGRRLPYNVYHALRLFWHKKIKQAGEIVFCVEHKYE